MSTLINTQQMQPENSPSEQDLMFTTYLTNKHNYEWSTNGIDHYFVTPVTSQVSSTLRLEFPVEDHLTDIL